MANKKDIQVYKLNKNVLCQLSPLRARENPSHYHDDHYELEMVVEGKGETLFNDQTFPLSTGDIYLMRPSDYHGHISNGLVFRQIQIKVEQMPKWAIKKSYALDNPKVFHIQGENFENIDRLMKLLEKELKGEEKYSEEACLSLVELIFTYFFRISKVDDDSNDIISKILYYLQYDNHFTKKITLEEVAEYVGYSKYYVSSIFHKRFGKTLQDYLINLRLEYAKKLLIQSQKSITDIIFESGFSTPSNFYTQFNKAYGVSPLALKKDSQKQFKL